MFLRLVISELIEDLLSKNEDNKRLLSFYSGQQTESFGNPQ